MDVDTYVLTANKESIIHTPGRFLMLMETNGPINIQLIKNRSRVSEVARNVESGYKTFPGDWEDREDRFDGFVLTSTTTQTVTVGVSERAGDLNQVQLGAGSKTQVKGNDTASYGTVALSTAAATQIKAATSGRHSISLQPQNGDIYVAFDNSVTSSNGFLVKSGQVYTTQFTGTVFAIRVGGSTVNVNWQEEVP